MMARPISHIRLVTDPPELYVSLVRSTGFWIARGFTAHAVLAPTNDENYASEDAREAPYQMPLGWWFIKSECQWGATGLHYLPMKPGPHSRTAERGLAAIIDPSLKDLVDCPYIGLPRWARIAVRDYPVHMLYVWATAEDRSRWLKIEGNRLPVA